MLCFLMLMPLVSATPEATVDITLERRLADFDLGINGGELSPNGETVLIYGAEGYAHVISATDADDENRRHSNDTND